MIRQLLIVGLSFVVATEALRIKSLQKRAKQRAPLSLSEIPTSYLESGYTDESFHGWDSKQERSVELLSVASKKGGPQVFTAFHNVIPVDSGYHFEPEYQSTGSSLLQTEATTRVSVTAGAQQEIEHPQLAGFPKGDFHLDSKFTIGVAPENYREALYLDSPASLFEMNAEASTKLHNVLEPEELPQSFKEAGYEGDNFFPEANNGEYSMDHKFTIGIVPDSYHEALYWDSPASAFFEMTENYTGEDFRKGNTEDVNDPNYEINHPTDHKHSKNVIGTKQEGHLFWTDTTQPNEEHYESTYDERERLSRTTSADDQAFSSRDEEDPLATGESYNCDDCNKEVGITTTTTPITTTTTVSPAGF